MFLLINHSSLQGFLSPKAETKHCFDKVKAACQDKLTGHFMFT